ncbi:hypothetical protein ACH4TX_09115 [Streptomyces sp. NPDC021098]|uniref:hypothetical protein n=1 Tax=unclassified Streptomyces TaxID=2593676 RepID=UPI0037B23561
MTPRGETATLIAPMARNAAAAISRIRDTEPYCRSRRAMTTSAMAETTPTAIIQPLTGDRCQTAIRPVPGGGWSLMPASGR